MSNYFRTFGTYDKISVLDQIKAHWSQNKEQGDFVFYFIIPFYRSYVHFKHSAMNMYQIREIYPHILSPEMM